MLILTRHFLTGGRQLSLQAFLRIMGDLAWEFGSMLTFMWQVKPHFDWPQH